MHGARSGAQGRAKRVHLDPCVETERAVNGATGGAGGGVAAAERARRVRSGAPRRHPNKSGGKTPQRGVLVSPQSGRTTRASAHTFDVIERGQLIARTK